MMLLAQAGSMSSAEQWNWVLVAYGFTFFVLVVFTASIAVRLSRVRRRLDEGS